MTGSPTYLGVFDLAPEEEQYGRARYRRQWFYFLVGTTACLVVSFGWALVSIGSHAASQGVLSLSGAAFLLVLGILVPFVIITTILILNSRPGAVTVGVNRDGIEFRYPSGRREVRSWRDRRACADLYEFRVNRLDPAWSLRPTGETYHAVAPPNPWSPLSFLPEAAYTAIESEAKREGLTFSRRPLYGGWGNTPSAIIRISVRPPKPERPLSPSSVRYLLRVKR